MTELSDELLVAHVDGRLSEAQARGVRRVADYDPATARRLEGMKIAHRQLEEAFDAMLAGEFTALTGLAPPPRDAAGEAGRPSATGRTRLKSMLAIAAACLLIGAAGGYGLRAGPGAAPPAEAPPAEVAEITGSLGEAATGIAGEARRAEPWQEEVSRAYALYDRDWLETSLESQANPDFVQFQINRVLGTSVPVPDLGAEGLTFRRAQILHHDGVPVAQIAYLPETGPPVALYIRPDAQAAAGPFLHATGDVAMAAWSHDGLSYLLAGRLTEDRLLALTAAVRGAERGAER